jgi:hypothetical protein
MGRLLIDRRVRCQDWQSIYTDLRHVHVVAAGRDEDCGYTLDNLDAWLHNSCCVACEMHMLVSKYRQPLPGLIVDSFLLGPMHLDHECHLALPAVLAGNSVGRSLCGTSAILVDGISCFAEPSWYISYFSGSVSGGSSAGGAYCERCLRLSKQHRPKTISTMSKTPPTTAPMAAFTPVERPGEDGVFAFGPAGAMEEATVEDEMVGPDVRDDVAALLADVEETAANCNLISTPLHVDSRLYTYIYT